MDGRKIAFDVSVVSPTQEALLFRAADNSAAAIESRKTSKNNAHFENCRAEGIHFQPLVVETFGGWDKDAVDFLKKIATKEARRWGKVISIEIKHFFQTSSRSSFSASSVISHFFQRLSVLLQRANAGLIAARAPAPPPPHVTGS